MANELCRLCNTGQGASLTTTGMKSLDFQMWGPLCHYFKLHWGDSRMSFCTSMHALKHSFTFSLYNTVYHLPPGNPACGAEVPLVRAVHKHRREIDTAYGSQPSKAEEHQRFSLPGVKEELQWPLVVNAYFVNSSAIREMEHVTIEIVLSSKVGKWSLHSEVCMFVYTYINIYIYTHK